jgi:hypothetical protein
MDFSKYISNTFIEEKMKVKPKKKSNIIVKVPIKIYNDMKKENIKRTKMKESSKKKNGKK